MIKWFEKLKLKFLLHIYHKTHSISPKGEMMLYYILNKYINREKPDDYIENYEEEISKCCPTFENAARIAIKSIPEMQELEGTEEQKITAMSHVFAAFSLFETLMISIHPLLREEWYERIKSPIIRETIRKNISTII